MNVAYDQKFFQLIAFRYLAASLCNISGVLLALFEAFVAAGLLCSIAANSTEQKKSSSESTAIRQKEPETVGGTGSGIQPVQGGQFQALLAEYDACHVNRDH